MIALELPLVEPEVEDVDDDWAHIVCCDPNVAFCGADVSGEDWDPNPVDEAKDCEVCVNKDRLGVPCGAAFCRLRSWWRGRRSS